MKQYLLTLILLLCSITGLQAQIITEFLQRNDTDLQPNAAVNHVLLNFENHGKKYFHKIVYNKDLKPVKKESFENDLQTYAVTYEYDSIGRMIRQDKRWKSTVGPQRSSTVFTWTDDHHAESTEKGFSGEFVNRSEIVLDDQHHPTAIESYDANDKFVSKETAIYDYDNNLVQICFYNHRVELIAMTITNIANENTKITFEDYLKTIDLSTWKPLCKNWRQFRIVMLQHTFKQDKEHHWKSYKAKRLEYEPYSGKYFSTDDGSAERKVVYEKQ